VTRDRAPLHGPGPPSGEPWSRRLAIIGVGLIGGSLAAVLRARAACGEVVGAARTRAHLERALELGLIDRCETDVRHAVDGADLVVVAVPLGATEAVLRAIAPALAPEAVLTDVGSAKRCVIEAARSAFGRLPAGFVPGHPIAGTEKSGVEAAFATLFERRRVILTPCPETAGAALERVQRMWQAAGARVELMDAARHDELLAATSHLPHMLAYTLVDALGRLDESEEIFRYAAGGFRDFTRIASSDPGMWHDICLANRDALLRALEHFQGELEQAVEALRAGDGRAMRELFSRAKRLRDAHVSPGQ